jgi:hyperosmotically inducible protein
MAIIAGKELFVGSKTGASTGPPHFKCRWSFIMKLFQPVTFALLLLGTPLLAVAAVADAPNDQTTVAAQTDTDISNRVKHALQSDSILKSYEIMVTSNDAAVELSGEVNKQAEVDQALRVATAVAGVKSVNNRLTIKE